MSETESSIRKMVEIRWHGRAGQGVVTASNTLAEAALLEEETLYFQSIPEFGAERSGAPIRAFSRFSNEPILHHYNVENPDVVVIFDPTLIGIIDMTEGLKKDGIVVANTQLTPSELRKRLGLAENIRVCTIDATRIAMETLGRNIPNVPMLGALLRATGVVSTESTIQQIETTFSQRYPRNIVDANKRAFELAYNETQQG